MTKRAFDQIAEGMREAIAMSHGSYRVVHQVVGFTKAGGMIEREFEVPAEFVVAARRIAEAPDDWEDAPGAFPLDLHAVRAISTLLKEQLNVDRYDWFLEPVQV